MLIKLENRMLEIIFNEEKLNLPNDLKEKINNHWENAQKRTPELWNGEIFCVTDCVEENDKVILHCSTSDYAHYLYDERIGCPKEYESHGLSGGTLFETSDGYYIIGETNTTTSYPRCLQVPGGGVDKKDISNGLIDMYSTMRREALEEINVDINSSNVISHKIEYISTPNEYISGYEIVAKAKLNMTANQVKEHYEKYKKYLEEKNLEIEFRKIWLLKKEDALEDFKKLENPRRKYLVPSIESDLEH